MTREAVERCVAQIRGVVTDQFNTTSQILKNMTEELEPFEWFDFTVAQRVSGVMTQNDIIPIDVNCYVDRYDCMTIEAGAMQVDRSCLNKASLTRQIS